MKKGTRVKVVNENAHFSGMLGTVDSPSWKTNQGQCYNINLDNGETRSFHEDYLSEVVVKTKLITLEQVSEAKKKVDKAQQDFVELLSLYQVQEASK